jgi:hypothetical protein
MDTDPVYERLNKGTAKPGSGMKRGMKNKITALLKDGTMPSDVARLTGTDPTTVKEIKNELQDTGQLDALAFKRRTALRLAGFIDKATERLNNEVDNIPIGQLMLSTAIGIDKLEKLVDPTPTVQVKAELKISAEDLNKMLSLNNDIIDVTPKPKPKSE